MIPGSNAVLTRKEFLLTILFGVCSFFALSSLFGLLFSGSIDYLPGSYGYGVYGSTQFG